MIGLIIGLVIYSLITIAVIKGSEIDTPLDAVKVVFWPVTLLIQIITGE